LSILQEENQKGTLFQGDLVNEKPRRPRSVSVVFPFPTHGVTRLFFILSLLLVGCVSDTLYEGVTFTRYAKKTFPPTPEVEVFVQDVDRPYTIIGELKMTFPQELSDEGMLNRMKEVSRDIGADAIIGLKREVVEIPITGVFAESVRKKARHERLEISRPQAKEERVLLRGLVIRYQ
jgi:hypothetical protein